MSRVFVETNNMNLEEWREYRKKGIGGSDAAAILGLNKYVSPFEVFADKTGLIDKNVENEATRQGHDLEDYVAQRFTEQTGLKVRRRNAILQHDEYDFMLANVDRLIVGEKNAGLECKTCSALTKVKFKNGEYPPTYYAQCMHYMAVTGADKWYLAVLVLGKEFHVFEIQRDEEEIEALIRAEKDFWENHVMANIPPDPDGTDSAGEIIEGMFVASKAVAVPLYGYENKIEEYMYLENQIKELEKKANAIKQNLQLELGENEEANTDFFKITWKPQTRATLNTQKLKEEMPEVYEKYIKTTSTRRFMIKKLEG